MKVSDAAPELDRQLSEQRAMSESLASRAGLMVGVTGALLAFAATRATAHTTDPKLGYWIISAAAVVGVVIFWTARVGVGPSPSAIVVNSEDDLAKSKMLLVEANSRVLLRAQVFFTAQVVLTIVGVFVLVSVMWGLP